MPTAKELAEQLSSPAHVFIELWPGNFMTHQQTQWNDGKIAFFRGEKIRFTKLAATSFLANWPQGRMVPCVTTGAA